MRIYSEEVVQRARELRRKNFSYRKIGRRLGVSDSTIRKWCFDITGGEGRSLREVKRNERLRKQLFDKGKNFIRKMKVTPISQEQARLLASTLYWCEGSKYPVETRVNFVNSNRQMMQTFIYLLRKGFSLDEEKFRVHLQVHDYHDLKKIKEYWSRLLKIPKDQFLKPTVTKPTGSRHRNQYRGTCTLRYYDYRVLLTLIAIYENFALTIT